MGSFHSVAHNASGREDLRELIGPLRKELRNAVVQWLEEMLRPQRNNLLRVIATSSNPKEKEMALDQLRARFRPEAYAAYLGPIFLRGDPATQEKLLAFYPSVGMRALKESVPALLDSYSKHLGLTASPLAISKLERLLLQLPTDSIRAALESDASVASYLRADPRSVTTDYGLNRDFLRPVLNKPSYSH